MIDTEENKRLDRTAAYLLSEFNVLHDRARLFEEVKSRRVNFFLLVVAAFGAVISGLAQTSHFRENILELIQVLSVAVFLLGVFLPQYLPICFISSALSAVIYWSIQRVFTKRKMLRIENSDFVKNTIHFPSSDYPRSNK